VTSEHDDSGAADEKKPSRGKDEAKGDPKDSPFIHVEDVVPESINGLKIFPRMSNKERQKYDAEHRLVTGVLHSAKYALDVKIGGFSLIFHGKELIKDTLLEFTIGRRYGLIGSNGSGKCKSATLHAQHAVRVLILDCDMHL
jgi:ATP-binding cassette subfamily F protein 2